MHSNFRSDVGPWARRRALLASTSIKCTTLFPTRDRAAGRVRSAPRDQRIHPVLRGIRNAALPSAMLWAGLLYLCFG